MHLLNAMTQHRAIDLLKKGAVDVDDVVRRDSEEVLIESRVMDLAQRQSVAYVRIAPSFPVADDVGGVQQLPVAEPANSTPGLVGSDHASPELPLVKPLADESLAVAALGALDVAEGA